MLETGIIVVAIALLAAWTRPGTEEPKATATPAVRANATPTRMNTEGLRFLGKNAKSHEEYENVNDGTILVKIPGGTFQMGSNESDSEKAVHAVALPRS